MARRRGAGEGMRVNERAREKEWSTWKREGSILLIRSIFIGVARFIYDTWLRLRFRPARFSRSLLARDPRARDHSFPPRPDIIRDETPVACTTCFRLHVSPLVFALSSPSRATFLSCDTYNARGIYNAKFVKISSYRKNTFFSR